MIDLNEKPEERLNTPRLAGETDEGAAALSSCLHKCGDAGASLYDDIEPLPSMFRRPAADTIQRFESTFDADATAPVDMRSRLLTSNVAAGFYPYVIAYFLFMVAGVGALLAPSISFDRAVSAEQGKTEMAVLFSSLPADRTGDETTTQLQTSSADGESWSETVETLKQLFAERKGSPLGAWEARLEHSSDVEAEATGIFGFGNSQVLEASEHLQRRAY